MLTKENSTNKEFTFPHSAPLKMQRSCGILSTASYLPEKIVTTEELCSKRDDGITEKAVELSIGVLERRVAEGFSDTDLLAEAAVKCLERSGIKAEELSKIIVNKFLGDSILPMTASYLQDKIGCTKAVQSFDIDGGINSFLQSFDIAQKCIDMGDKYILIVSGGIINGLTDVSEPRNVFTYGDGAAAILLGPAKKSEFEASYFFSNYDYVDLYTGFSRSKKYHGHDFFEKTDFEDICSMYETGNWMQAREFILEAMQHTSDQLLEQADLDIDDIDLFLITENNVRMWRDIISKIGIPQEKCCSLIEKYGNTLSAMIPLMINDARESGRLKDGMRVMILSVGEGINGGGIIYKQ